MWRRVVTITVVLPALIGVGAASAAETGPSATGGSHLTVHDVFGLNTQVLQDFGFNARLKSDGSADGWFTYRDVEDGAPFSAGGPVTCFTAIGEDAWIGATITQSNDSTIIGLGA
jgi:hypothetical protein